MQGTGSGVESSIKNNCNSGAMRAKQPESCFAFLRFIAALGVLSCKHSEGYHCASFALVHTEQTQVTFKIFY